MTTLHHVLAAHGHVVAKVVEAELRVGAVGDVGVVLHAPLFGGHVRLDDADFETEEAVDLPHPLRIALGQIVVDGDEMGAVTGETVEVHGHGRHQGLALAGLHLRDVAVVEHDAAHHLDIEGTHPERPPGALPVHREGFEQEVVEQLAVLMTLAKLDRLGAQLVVAEAGVVGLEGSHSRSLFLQGLQAPALAGVQQLVDHLDHGLGAPRFARMGTNVIVAHRTTTRVPRARAAATRELQAQETADG